MNNNSNSQNKNNHGFKNRNRTYNMIPYQSSGMYLVPQYNKYISIYNNHYPPLNNINSQLKEKERQENTKLPASKITRIVVKRPNNQDEEAYNSNNKEMVYDDTILNSILSNILLGKSSMPVENKLNINKIKTTQDNFNNTNVEDIVVPIIDYSNMLFIDEHLKTIDDLLIVINKIGKEYSLNKYYNIDIKKLNNIKTPLQKLSKMIGLEGVKSKIVDIILYYSQRLDIRNYDLLHTIIDGAPGTGKTEIAHIYSEILMGLGILSKNTFKIAKKNDFIGGYLGHTALKTMKLLEEVKGGVLFIDEIYSLGNSDGKEGKDIYAKEFVDLLMQYMSENKGDFVLVVAGYKNDIKQFFLSMNDGLERRFPIHLSIGEYSPLEMYKIFLKKVNELKWKLDDDLLNNADFFIKFFEENKEYFKFFGGDMEILLTKCKFAHSRNLLDNRQKKHRIITLEDYKDGFDLYKQNPEIEERKLSPKFQSYFI